MSAEKNLQTDIHIGVGSLPGVVLFRNNTGMGWVGKIIRKYLNGNIEMQAPRPLHAGLCVGSSDLIGFVSVVVTPEMVGQRVAIFAAVEVKTETGVKRKDQEKFIAAVRRNGGIAGFVRSISQAVTLLTSLPA